MTKEDFKRFGVAWTKAQKLYGKEVEGDVLAMVFKLLGEFQLADVEEALARHMKSCEFAPKPADIVRQIEGERDERVAIAWAQFREATSSGDPPQDPALCEVIRRMGGLERLGERTQRDVDFMRPQFAALWNYYAAEPARIALAQQRREALEDNAA